MAIKNKGKILTFGAISTFLLAFNNCGRPMEAIDSAAKSDFLKKSSVLNVPKSVVSMQAVNGEEPITPPVVNGEEPVTEPTVGGGTTSIPAKLICSNAETSSLGVNVVQTESISVEIVQYAIQADSQLKETSRCVDDSATLKDDLINTKTLKLKKCAAVGQLLKSRGSDSGAQVVLNIENSASIVGAKFYSAEVKSANGKVLNSSRGDDDGDSVKVLFDINNQSGANFESSNSRNQMSVAATTAENQEKCDQRASPLFVDLRSQEQAQDIFSLSAPWAGVRFDILGRNR